MGGFGNMKKSSHIAVRLFFFVMLLIPLFFISDTLITGEKEYDPSAETSWKFEKVSRYFPSDYDFYIAVDVYRALQDPEVSNFIAGSPFGGIEYLSELSSYVASGGGGVGLVTLVGRRGDDMADVIAIIEGGFGGQSIAGAVKGLFAADGGSLDSMRAGGLDYYYEDGSQDPFAFVALDSTHIALGYLKSLESCYSNGLPHRAAKDLGSSSSIFGFLRVSDAQKKAVQWLRFVDNIRFASQGNGEFLLSLGCSSMASAMDTVLYLEGFRSLYLMEEKDSEFAGAIERVGVSHDDKGVYLKTDIRDLATLLKYISGTK
jgi:hypothetical protein